MPAFALKAAEEIDERRFILSRAEIFKLWGEYIPGLREQC